MTTVVDPVRGVGEPDIAIDSSNNAWITGPGGSSTQTSFFWHSLDGGLTYPMLGPSGGHWVCSASELMQMMENAGRSLAELAVGAFAPTSVTVLAGTVSFEQAI